MSVMNSSNARQHFPSLIDQAAYNKKRTVVTKRGKRVAAIVPIEDLETIEALEDRVDLEEARIALRDVKRRGGVSWKKLKAELDL